MIEVERVGAALVRHGERFYARFFTPREREICAGQVHRLAARFAAKEAVAKALGTGIGEVRWVDIEIDCDVRGRPVLILHGVAAARASQMGLAGWDVSLSHTETHAIAFAVALHTPPHGGQ